jgi:hypothetical protein
MLVACTTPSSTVDQAPSSPTPAATPTVTANPTPRPTMSATPAPPTAAPTPDAVAQWAQDIGGILSIAAGITADTKAVSEEFARCDFSRLTLFNTRSVYSRQELQEALRGLTGPTSENQLITGRLQYALELEIQADVPRSTAAMLESVQGTTPCTGGDRNSVDADATDAKAEFLSFYNPIAELYGLRTWQPDDF